MITLEQIRKNGISDVLIFQILNFINEFKKGEENIIEIFQKEFLNFVFIFTIFYLKLKNEKFNFPKWTTKISLVVLNLILFLDRSYFQLEVNRMIDFIQTINLYFIFSAKFKK
jgi:hypothetical protein